MKSNGFALGICLSLLLTTVTGYGLTDYEAASTYPTYVFQPGQPIIYRWNAEYEANLQFTLRRVKYEASARLIESTCEGEIAPFGVQKLDAAVVEYSLRWSKNPNPDRIGKSVEERDGGIATHPMFWGAYQAEVPEIKNRLQKETLKLKGFNQLLATTETPDLIPKSVLESNSGTNLETGENEFAALASVAGVSVQRNGDETTFASAKFWQSMPGFRSPSLFLEGFETVFLLQQKKSEGSEVCQLRLSVAPPMSLRQIFENSPIEQPRKNAIFLLEGLHGHFANDVLLTNLIRSLRDFK